LFTRIRSIAWPLCAVTALIALAAPFAAQKLSALATAQVHGLAPDLPRLLVRPLDDLGGANSSASVAKGLTQEIAGQIAKFKDIVVIEPGSESDPKADVAAPSVTFPARYVLAGSIALSESSLRLQVRVLDQTDGAILWADSYYGDLKVGQLLQIETELARKVATTLGQPYGVIFRADASRNFVSPPEDWEAYFCTLKYYTYRVNLDAATHSSVRKCLERAVERYPAYATAWALLSLTYLDEIRFHYPVDPSASPASIDRILTAARRAVELDPQNVRALQAEMFALYFHGDLQAALKVGEQAMALNPNDTELMGEYGYRLAASGDRARGCELLAQAREQNPSARGYYESGLAPCAYFRADF